MTFQIQRFAAVESTMTLAAPMPLGSVVVADQQTAGIGRHEHAWESPPGAGLYVSIVLAPHPVLTLALGLAAEAAIRKVTSLACDIRWPNDVLVSGRKVGGILTQLHGERAVAGVGLNILQNAFPQDLVLVATSLFLETGLEFHRDDLLDALLEEIPRATALPRFDVITRWEAVSSWAWGKAVNVDLGDRTVSGITAGLDHLGFLRIREDNGHIETILAGGVRAR